jgi:hypothetical protein
MAVPERGVLVATPDRTVDVRRPARSGPVPWRLVGFAGLSFALLGWTDALLLWYPLRIGMPDWEFATISGMFDALPLATIGTLLVVAWLLVEGNRPGRLLVGSALLVVVFGLCAAFVLFALSFLTGLGAVDGDTQWLLVRAGIKTSVAAFAYVTLHILMALSLFRATRKDRSA